jgi:hypothetical protein
MIGEILIIIGMSMIISFTSILLIEMLSENNK